MKQLESIQDFILQHKDYFRDGLDISKVQRKYRREVGSSVGRSDVSECLTQMQKKGILTTNWRTQLMEFNDE